MGTVTAIDVCFIGGFGRSGSTLLERLLGEVPGVCALGEVVHLWRRGIVDDELCGCGEPFSRCEFWSAVGREAFGGWHRVDTERVFRLAAEVDRFRAMTRSVRALRHPDRPSSVRSYAEYFERVYAAAKLVSGAAVITDSSKNASTAYALRAGARLEMRVLHIVRDSRGVAFSWAKEVARPETGESSTKPLMDRYSAWKSALLWDAHNLAFMGLRRASVPVQRIRYEDLVRRPATTIESAAAFLNIDMPRAGSLIDGGVVTLSPSHQVAGNPMRFQRGEVQLRPDNAWRTSFAARPRRVVATLTSPLLLGYGYLRADVRDG